MKDKTYELFYGTGGHGGPYRNLQQAIVGAAQRLKGDATERRITIKPRTSDGVGGYGDSVFTLFKDGNGNINTSPV